MKKRRSFAVPRGKPRAPAFKWRKVARSAKTGRFCSLEHAKHNPDTTIVQRIRIWLR